MQSFCGGSSGVMCHVTVFRKEIARQGSMTRKCDRSAVDDESWTLVVRGVIHEPELVEREPIG